MSDVNNLFGNTDTDLGDVTGDDALSQLVGEGKKYATAAELAKGMLHGQVHIGKIEQENSDMRDTANKAKGVDEILAALKGQQQQPSGDIQQQADQQASGPEDLGVEALIAKAFADRDSASQLGQEASNRQSVIDSLAQTYGAQASQVYAAVGQDLGLNLDDLAAKSPNAVLKLVAQARPAQAAASGLPVGSHQGQMGTSTSGTLNKAAIQKMYAEGKIKSLADKHALENKQLTLMGDKLFYG